MAHEIRHWPPSVYPDEVDDECPQAREVIDVLLMKMGQEGPSPVGYRVKTLGKKMGGLWQINLKVEKQQIRILYAPYGQSIVLFRIHRKSSPAEQTRAYELAKQRKSQYDGLQKQAQQRSKRPTHDGNSTLH